MRPAFIAVAALVSVASAAPLRFKRQYESEIVAISPQGKWTSIYHQPLDSIRDKGLPLLEHHGALRDVQTYPQTGPNPSPYAFPAAYPGYPGYPGYPQPYLNTLISPSTNPLPAAYGQPRLLIIVPPGTNLPASLAAPAAPVAAALPAAVPVAAPVAAVPAGF
ncbi:hypothetical protein PFISCL1PPCAC_4640 [Pristionchus fissidentatus]|uniref:Uncharacterized protein n=1 Tax=Pristionchus fissidentatus TaxID=1538716 RepID=A0AAV5V4R3_9BILA|nr:hypothetical protein PFISCL1PPCAC_4640 [Pristionchus fissidentatus]